jgi:hypothetical protein
MAERRKGHTIRNPVWKRKMYPKVTRAVLIASLFFPEARK